MSYHLNEYEFLANWATVRLYRWLCLYYGIPYLVIAGCIFFAAHILARREPRRKIQIVSLPHWQLAREISLSALSIGMFGAIAIWQFARDRIYGQIHIYSGFAPHAWLYMAGSLVLIIVAHDAYFYWTHRLMHLPVVFPLLHRTHHRSREPTAWAAYAFHPGEAVVQAAFVPFFTAILPIHWIVFTAFMLHVIGRATLIHSGVEMMPASTVDRRVLRWLITPTHHDLHHGKGSGNYGLYFTWWDRLMGTERSEYAREFRRHATGEAGEPSAGTIGVARSTPES